MVFVEMNYLADYIVTRSTTQVDYHSIEVAA
jgi:hypothetical protein